MANYTIEHREIAETIVSGKRLGRHIHTDTRNANYPAETASEIRSVKHACAGLPLDQGDVGSCTAEALCGSLNTVPHWAAGNPTLTQKDAYALYGLETKDEGQPWPPNDPGGSGLEVCKVAKKLGYLDGYQHATTVDDALKALVIRPVITGVNWYTSFDTPDSNGVIAIARGATVRGGHEFVAVEIDATNSLVWFVQSWGLQYGVARNGLAGGMFAMAFTTWGTLLNQQGDVTIPRTAKGWKA
jgi:hypothetical protein